MKRIAKIILSVLAGLVILLVVALIGINLYLQSSDVQQRIRMATEQALGMPVAVKRTIYTPWSGLTLSGLSLPDPTIPNTALVEAPKFSIKFQFFPLFQRRFVISQISLTSPHLVLRQTADKKWVLVPPRLAPKPDEKKIESKPAAPSSPRLAPFIVELRNFYIYDGSAEIIDHKGATLARVKGLSINGVLPEQHRVAGSIWVEDIEIGGRIYPNRLRADFVLADEMFSVTNLKCAIAGGKVRAELTVVAPRKGTPAFQLRSQIEDVSISTLISEAQGDGSSTSGKLLGRLELRGNPLDASTLVGGGEFSLEAAHLRPFEIIRQVGVILHVDELQLLKLREARMRYVIRNEKFWLNDLRLKTENLVIIGQGPIKFNGKMNLTGRFLINEKIQRELSLIIGDQFIPSTEAGYKEVPFTVTGRTSRPESNLLKQIIGYDLGNISNFGNVSNLGSLLKSLSNTSLKSPDPTPKKSPNQETAN